MSTVTAMIWPEKDQKVSHSQRKQSCRPVRQPDIEQHSSFSDETSKAEICGLKEEQLLALTGRMVHGVAHDIRHYMSAILANTDVIDDPQMSPNTRDEIRQDVRDAVNDICKMLDLTLLCARQENGVPTSLEDLGDILCHAIRMVQCHPDGRKADITFDQSISYRQCVNSVLLSSALFNMVLNACQATLQRDGSGAVHVNIDRMDSVTSIRVTDNGPGIPESIKCKLFESFRTKRSNGEYGLGLAFADHAARVHGGSLRLEESRPGKTVFALSLPWNPVSTSCAQKPTSWYSARPLPIDVASDKLSGISQTP
jgi:signal transduction histidine kinase